jgi:hypothetical protein
LTVGGAGTYLKSDGTDVSWGLPTGPFEISENSQTITLGHDGADGYINWDLGELILQTEVTDSSTTIAVKPDGTSNVSAIELYDAGGKELRLFTEANRGYITSVVGDLGLNRSVNKNVLFFENAASGFNPYVYIYGYKSAVSVKYGRLRVDANGDFSVEAESGEDLLLIGDNVVVDKKSE